MVHASVSSALLPVAVGCALRQAATRKAASDGEQGIRVRRVAARGRDRLRCGDWVPGRVFRAGSLRSPGGPGRESWPVPGEIHVPSLGTGCFKPFATPSETVLVGGGGIAARICARAAPFLASLSASLTRALGCLARADTYQ